jgi:hypothetical protein
MPLLSNLNQQPLNTKSLARFFQSPKQLKRSSLRLYPRLVMLSQEFSTPLELSAPTLATRADVKRKLRMQKIRRSENRRHHSDSQFPKGCSVSGVRESSSGTKVDAMCYVSF